MKLKKIASLALAGVMAVSMLAGCSEKTGDDTTDGDNNGTVATSPVVSAVNDAQDKIDFTSDNSLTNALKKAVAEIGANGADASNELEEYVAKTTGIGYDKNLLNENSEPATDGSKKTIVKVVPITSEDAWTEDAVIVKVTDAIEEEVNGLADTTFVAYDPDYDWEWGRPGRPGHVVINPNDATQVGDKYNNYSYTGTVSDLVSVTSMNGTTNYYVAYTITQTTAVLTYEA